MLSNFCQINPSLTIYPGSVVRTIALSRDTFASARVEESFSAEVSIYNLKSFLAVLSLFDEPDVTFTPTHAVITGGGSECRFTLGNSSLFKTKDQEPKLPDHQASFKLQMTTLKAIHKAASVLTLDTLVIGIVGGKVTLTVSDPKNPSKNVFKVTDLEARGNDVRVPVRLELLVRAMMNDYEVLVGSNYVKMVSSDGISYLFPSKVED